MLEQVRPVNGKAISNGLWPHLLSRVGRIGQFTYLPGVEFATHVPYPGNQDNYKERAFFASNEKSLDGDRLNLVYTLLTNKMMRTQAVGVGVQPQVEPSEQLSPAPAKTDRFQDVMGVIDRHLQARNDEAKGQEELERELELADYNDGPTV